MLTSILDIFRGTFALIAPKITSWYATNTEYIIAGIALFAVATLFVLLLGVDRNKKGNKK